jgi:uncharacterized membrane protein
MHHKPQLMIAPKAKFFIFGIQRRFVAHCCLHCQPKIVQEAGMIEKISTDITPPRRTVRGRLRTYFLTGVVVAAPLVITGALVLWVINSIDQFIRPILPDALARLAVPGLGLVIAVVGLTLLGAITANVVGRFLLRMGDEVLTRLPFIGTIYRPMRQMFNTLVKPGARSFRDVVLVEYPRAGAWTLAFVTGDAPATAGAAHVCLFVPTSPNLYAGLLIFVPQAAVKPAGFSVEDAIKFQLSMGLASIPQPERNNSAAESLSNK